MAGLLRLLLSLVLALHVEARGFGVADSARTHTTSKLMESVDPDFEEDFDILAAIGLRKAGPATKRRTGGGTKKLLVLAVEGHLHPGRTLCADRGQVCVPTHVHYLTNALSTIKGFDLVNDYELLVNPTYNSKTKTGPALDAIKNFATRCKAELAPDGVCMFVFSGHGMQIQGGQELLFYDPKCNGERSLDRGGRPMRERRDGSPCTAIGEEFAWMKYDDVVGPLFKDSGGMNIHLLDACRVSKDPRFQRRIESGDPGANRAKKIAEQKWQDTAIMFAAPPGVEAWHEGNPDQGQTVGHEVSKETVIEHYTGDRTDLQETAQTERPYTLEKTPLGITDVTNYYADITKDLQEKGQSPYYTASFTIEDFATKLGKVCQKEGATWGDIVKYFAPPPDYCTQKGMVLRRRPYRGSVGGFNCFEKVHTTEIEEYSIIGGYPPLEFDECYEPFFKLASFQVFDKEKQEWSKSLCEDEFTNVEKTEGYKPCS